MEEFNILFSLALRLVAGLFMSRLMKPLGLPAVTSYLVAGILIGPFVLGRLGITGLFSSLEELSTMGSLVQDVALGFIAFAIGNEFKLSDLKHTGKQAAVVGVVQSVAAMIVVDAVLIGLHFALGQEVLPLSVAITLGATATATAPAATLMVVRQYKAKGPLTDILLPVVALDDAVGLICFSVSIGVARAVEGGAVSVISTLVNPLLEGLLSLLLGTLAGVIFTAVESLFKSNSKRLCLSITFVLLTIALSQLEYTFDSGLKISFSSLLVCMMLGTQSLQVCGRADGQDRQVDNAALRFVLCHQRRGAGFHGFLESCGNRRRFGICGIPLPRQVHRCAFQCRSNALPAVGCKVSRHYVAPAGGRFDRNVDHCRRGASARFFGTEHCSLCRSDLRVGWTVPDQVGFD